MGKRVALRGIGLVLALAVGVWADQNASIVPRMPEPGEAPAGSPVATHGQLNVTSGKITGKAGAVQLKGMSMFWSNSGTGSSYYNGKVVSWLAHDWKVDIIRVAVGAESDGTNPGYTDNATAASAQESRARAVIEEGIKRGIYLIIDWHAHGKFENQAKSFFQTMARDYGKYPNILYELWNEPKNDDASSVNSYSSSVASAIRAIDAKNIIIVGSPFYSSQPHNVSVSGTNIAYSIHFYANEHKIGSASNPSGYGGNVKTALGQGKAVFATEWGTTNADAKSGYSESESSLWLDFLANEKVGWTNWAVTNDNTNITSILNKSGTNGNWATGDLTNSGKYVRGKMSSGGSTTYKVTVTQPTAGGTIDVSKLKASYGWEGDLDLTAVPNDGWELKTWTGDAIGNTNALKGTFYGLNLSVSAEFYNGGVLKNGHFTYDYANWSAVAAGNAKASVTAANSECEINVTAAGSVGDLRFGQTAASGMLAADHEYELKFTARGDARDVLVRLTSSNNVSTYGDTLKASLTSSPKEFTQKFIVRRGAAVQGGGLAFLCGDKTGKWYLSKVSLKDLGAAPPTGVAPRPAVSGARASWAVVNGASGLQLRGPAGGAEIALYNSLGKMVRSMAAADGQALNVSALRAPAGSYLLVVRNRDGSEAYKTRVSLAK